MNAGLMLSEVHQTAIDEADLALAPRAAADTADRPGSGHRNQPTALALDKQPGISFNITFR